MSRLHPVSSDPSLQVAYPSHLYAALKQRGLPLHWKSSPSHWWLSQSCSSDRSPQSLSPSQRHVLWMQRRVGSPSSVVGHWICSASHSPCSVANEHTMQILLADLHAAGMQILHADLRAGCMQIFFAYLHAGLMQ